MNVEISAPLDRVVIYTSAECVVGRSTAVGRVTPCCDWSELLHVPLVDFDPFLTQKRHTAVTMRIHVHVMGLAL